MKKCSVDECENGAGNNRSGYCEKHRTRFRRHGDPNISLKDNTPAVERWKKLYTIDDRTGCWNWTGQKSRGYGVISDGAGVQHTAHRFVWVQLGGVLIDGLELDHKCRNKGCVNPQHLEQVTHTINVRRGDAGRNNWAKTECIHGHKFTEANTVRTKKGNRQCAACMRRSSREANARLRARRKGEAA